MNLYIEPERNSWEILLQRPSISVIDLLPKVQTILEEVRAHGDNALLQFTKEFDKVTIDSLLVDDATIKASEQKLSNGLKTAIQLAKTNLEIFHQLQVQKAEKIETMPGVWCWRKSVGIEKVGLYIPGGTAPLFSTVLMLGIPAKLAGCKEIILCSPPNEHGEINPAIIYAAMTVGITKIYKVGGVQAIAAMAFGTESISKVHKIFGPGNQYVTAAKQLIQQKGIAIDMPAGPSEVCVWADESCDPSFVAADLLSQAEHGVDSQVVLIANTENIIQAVEAEIIIQLEQLPRKNIAIKALENSKAIILSNQDIAIELINEYAPEHLILAVENAVQVAEKIVNAGSVFIGNFSPESVGDYASGTNHTLPTNGHAKAYSGVSVDSFVKKITFQQLTAPGIKNISSTVIEMAEAEGLHAHANAVAVRIKSLTN